MVASVCQSVCVSVVDMCCELRLSVNSTGAHLALEKYQGYTVCLDGVSNSTLCSD